MLIIPSTSAADSMFRANPQHTGIFDTGGIVPTNTELWHFKMGYYVESMPTVSDSVVYVGSDYDKLYAIDAVTGKEKWNFKMGSDEYLSSPAVSNDIVYVGSEDKNLYAIDAVTGKEKWRFTTGGGVGSSPAVSDSVVYVGSNDKNLYAIDAVTGIEKWRFTTGGGVSSSPAVSDSVVYIGSNDKNLYAIDSVTGKEKWRFTTEGYVFSSPAVSDNVIYFGSWDKNLYAIDAVTGKEKWRFTTGDLIRSSPAVSNNIIYVGSEDKNLYAIDAETGKEKWRFTTGGGVSSSPAVSESVVYVGSKDCNLYTLDAVTGKELWQFTTGNWVISSPAVANGVVYVGSWDHNLYAVGVVLTNSSISTTTKTIPTQTTVSSLSQQPSTSTKNLTNIIPVILVGVVLIVLVIGGIGYFRWRRKIPDTNPHTPGPRSESVASLYPVSKPSPQLSTRLESVTRQSDSLTFFKVTVTRILTEVNRSIFSENFSDAERLLSQLETGIPHLKRCELNITSWKGEGYLIDPQLISDTGTIDQIRQRCDTLYQKIAKLRTLERDYQKLATSYSSLLNCRDAQPFIRNIGQNIRNPEKITDIEKALSELNTLIELDAQVGKAKESLDKWTTDGYSVKLPENVSQKTAREILANIKNLEEQIKTLQRIDEELTHIQKTDPVFFSQPDILTRSEKIRQILKDPARLGDVQRLLFAFKRDQADFEKIQKTAKPELAITIDTMKLTAARWHKLGITLTNHGLAQANDVTFTFSNEFETKGIKPVTVRPGQSSRTDISILPKNDGNVLLEVTLKYKDPKREKYETVQEFWVDVADRISSASEPGMATPPTSSPVSHYSPKPDTPKQLPPDLSDRYTESEFIGKGGFARVFKAKRKDGKFVAVKIPISMDAVTGKSFIAEMQNWTKLSHPNIVGLYDFNIMPMPFFEEELCDCALADQVKPVECEEAAWILFNICEGLKFAHDRKIIHRDLKPQNILLKNGVPKISDWGLSRVISEATTTSATSFTPYYAAPEQINNRAKDERTDIWQLGVILYELVTGVLPFQGDSMIEIGMGIATKDPKRPSEITPDAHVIDVVVMKCLQKDPAKRYQSVLELQKNLALYLRENYADLLKTSVTVQDYSRSAFYCGDLVMINMLTGDIQTAYKYLLDLAHYSKGDVKSEARELAEQIQMRMDMGVTEIPEELIQKAEIIVHQVSVGFRKKG